MEFHEKLQELRKRKGLTQEELASSLYVSRAAVSKWESGRGYPSIDSLKRTAVFFGVTIDELLSGNEVLTIAEKETKEKEGRFRDLVFGVLDCSSVGFFFLPFFAQKAGETVSGVSLLMLSAAAPYMRAAYFFVVAGMIVTGILTLVLSRRSCVFWERSRRRISLLSTAAALFVFIASPQPYAAAVLFVFLVVKVSILRKWQ